MLKVKEAEITHVNVTTKIEANLAFDFRSPRTRQQGKQLVTESQQPRKYPEKQARARCYDPPAICCGARSQFDCYFYFLPASRTDKSHSLNHSTYPNIQIHQAGDFSLGTWSDFVRS